jgi:hypothetical protein
LDGWIAGALALIGVRPGSIAFTIALFAMIFSCNPREMVPVSSALIMSGQLP